MPANVDGMVREGVSAYRAGRKDEARALLMRAVEIDQYNEQAWLWLSAVVESVDEQRTCLENVITINPGNERAKQGLQVLNQKASSAFTSSPASSSDDVLASTSFTAQPSPPMSAPPAPKADEELPSSIEWDAPVTASSSASSAHRVNEPSEAEYDDWVSNLNLGGAAAPSQPVLPPDAEKFMSLPTDDDEDDEIFDFNTALGLGNDDADPDDLFASGPFSAPATPVPSSQKQKPATKTPAPASRTPLPKSRTPINDSLLDELAEAPTDDADLDDEFDDGDFEKAEPSEFFRYIPKEIKATRLPGTHEGLSVVTILGLVVMLVLNIGAVAFMVSHLTGG
jgi:hypothetical protein